MLCSNVFLKWPERNKEVLDPLSEAIQIINNQIIILLVMNEV